MNRNALASSFLTAVVGGVAGWLASQLVSEPLKVPIAELRRLRGRAVHPLSQHGNVAAGVSSDHAVETARAEYRTAGAEIVALRVTAPRVEGLAWRCRYDLAAAQGGLFGMSNTIGKQDVRAPHVTAIERGLRLSRTERRRGFT